MIHWAHPENLWYLLAVIPLVGIYAGYLYWRRLARDRMGDSHLVEQMAKQSTNGWRTAKAACVLVGLSLFVVASAQPQWGRIDRELPQKGVDLVFALDASDSMRAEDIAPNRFRAAKSEIRDTTSRLSGHRVGLVIFTSTSFVQSPLTSDYGAIRFYLDKLKPGDMPAGGTDFRAPLTDSLELLTGGQLKDGKLTTPKSDMERADTQVVIFITDGENHGPRLGRSLELAKKHGIRVVTVGLGSQKGAKIPIKDDQGNIRGYKRDNNGDIVRTSLATETLKQMASETGGRYLEYTSPKSVTNRIVEFVRGLKKSKMKAKQLELYKDRYMYFLIPGLLFILFALLIRQRRGAGPFRRLFRGIFAVTLVAIVGLAPGCKKAFYSPVEGIEKANQLLENEKYTEALQKYKALETQGESSPRLKYNKGLAYLGAEQFEESREAFGAALSTDKPSLHFKALFNIAKSFSEQQNWTKAYDGYKKALQYAAKHPDKISSQVERKAKHNLAVAYRKLHPPCSELEDDKEQNDSPAEATTLKKKSHEKLTLCGLDEDWYAIPVKPGSRIEVKSTFTQLRERPDPERTFLPKPSKLEVALLNGDGDQTILSSNRSPWPPEQTRDNKEAERNLRQIDVTEQMVGKSNRLFVKVGAADNTELQYKLEIDVIPPCPEVEDKYEPNETVENAAQIEKGSHELQMCPNNQDWFRLDLGPGDSAFVDVKPAKRKGDQNQKKRLPALDLKMVGPGRDGPSQQGSSYGKLTTVGAPNVQKEGTYYIRVEGSERTPYKMNVYKYAPCTLGDDRHEANDSLEQAAEVKGERTMLRYLRLCSNNKDFFKVKKGKKDRFMWGLSRVGGGPSGDSKDESKLELDLLDAESGESFGSNKNPDKARAMTGRNSSKGLKLNSLVRAKDEQRQEAVLKVTGNQTFYHLVNLNPAKKKRKKKKKKQQKKNKNKKNKQNKDKKRKKKKKSDKNSQKKRSQKKKSGNNKKKKKQSGDKSKKKKDSSGQKKKQKKNADKGDKNKSGKRKKSGDKKKKKQKAARAGEKSKKQKKEEQIEDLLRAIEKQDGNIQLEKARDKAKRQRPRKDW